MIDTLEGNLSTDEIIKRVVDRKIKYTVADRNLARINASTYPILDVSVPVSFSQRIGWAMRKDTEVAGALFQQALNLQRWTRPPKQKLDGSDWRLLNELVSDDEVKAPLKSYFAIVETLWG